MNLRLVNKILLCIGLINCLYGQNFNTNLRKYWYYKSRLNNDFTKVGTGQGESLIFNERGLNTSTKMKIGDGTSTLGYYIAQLALEYYLLTINHQRRDSTLYELACALYAINRLDIEAEATLNNSNCTGLLNGFFLRDDVPCNFIQNNYEHFNYFSAGINNNNQSRGFASKFSFGMDGLEGSDWCINYELNNNTYKDGENLYLSQDQVYNLLYGLAFVRKFIPEGVIAKDRMGNTFWFQDGQVSISIEAKNIAKRIIDNIRNPKKCDGSSCTGDDWDIKFPNNCKDVPSKGIIKPFFPFPLGETECILDHTDEFGDNFTVGVCSSSKCMTGPCSAQYHTIYSLTGSRDAWNALLSGSAISNIFGTGNVSNHVMKGNLLAVCNCYYLFNNSSKNAIDDNARIGNYYWYLFHQPIGRYLLHGSEKNDLIINNEGGGSHPERNTPVFLLNEMNPCNHFNFGGNNYGSLGWSTDSRLDHPERIGTSLFNGEYNGVDYMLYFNLWTLKTALDYSLLFPPNYQNFSHFYINNANLTSIFYYYPGLYNPDSAPLTANNAYKTQVDAYETIYMEKTKLNYYSNLSYMRAGREIILKSSSTPGDGSETYIRPGKLIKAISDGTVVAMDAGIRFYIKKYDCATDNGSFDPYVDPSYSYRLISENDTLLTNERKNITKDDSTRLYKIPHYVDYSTDDLNPQNNLQLENTEITTPKVVQNFYYVKLIPNPADNIVLIEITDNFEYDHIEISNVFGQIIDKYNYKNQEKIFLELKNYSSGLYFITFYNNENKLFTVKLIKK